MAQSQAAVVQVVDELDAKDGAEECSVREGSGAEGLGKVGEVGAEKAEPLEREIVLAADLFAAME